MMNLKKRISKDLISTAINQLWRLVSGPLMLIFIPIFLTPETQGYWYSFISLSALSIFADLGFSNIVLQFAAHEFAYLSFNDELNVQGDELHMKKLASFLVFTIKWAILMIVIVFPIILIVGISMFNGKHLNVNWMIPWIIYLVGSAISFFNGTLLAFIQGCNLVSVSQKIQFFVGIVNTCVVLVCLFFKFNLYALAFGSIISASLIFIFFFTTFKKFLIHLIKISKTFKYSWKKEFFRLLWKYSISFASGYFIFQIYTPFMFQFRGPVQAGRVGISISIWSAIFSISTVWIIAITPKLNMLIAKKEWKKLDQLFFKNLILSVGTFLLGTICAFVILTYFKGKIKIIDRFLPIFPMLCLSMGWTLQTLIDTLAIYLRAHKQEPLVLVSAVSAIYIVITTFLCAKYLPSDYFFLGFLSSYIWQLPWVLIIFYKKRKEWHKDDIEATSINNSNTNIQ